MQCPHCQRTENQVKNGKTVAGSQVYKCKACNRKYTPQPKAKGHDLETRQRTIRLALDVKYQWQGIQNIEITVGTGAKVADIHPFTYDMTLDSGPDELSLDPVDHLFGREPGHPVYLPIVLRDGDSPPDTFFEPDVELRIEGAAFDDTSTLPSQIYLLEGGISNPTRTLYQGKVTNIPSAPIVGTATILGAKPGDGIIAFTDQYVPTADDPPVAPNAQYIYTHTILGESDLRDGITLVVVKQLWQYKLEMDFEPEAGLVK